MTPKLNLKNQSVKWEVVPEIEAAQDIIELSYINARSKAIVTSAHDGNHSLNSAHKQTDPKALSQAIDIRITNLFTDVPVTVPIKSWYEKLEKFARLLAYGLNMYVTGEDVLTSQKIFRRAPMQGRFIILIEANHFHLEVYYPPSSPNLIAYKPSEIIYKSKEVKGYMV